MTSETTNLKLYGMYLAADRISKELERLGVALSYLHYAPLNGIRSKPYVSVSIDYDANPEARYWGKNEQERQEEHERVLLGLMKAFPKAYVDRRESTVELFIPFHKFEVKVTIGQALCQRVVTGTKIREVPDPDYIRNAPTVTVEEDIVEWRCNDDIMGRVISNGV